MALVYFPCSIVSMGSSDSAADSYEWNGGPYLYVGGYESQAKYRALKIELKTPAYDLDYLCVKLRLLLHESGALATTSTFKYAICTSDANDTLYMHTHDDVVDENQIASGVVVATDVTNNFLSQGDAGFTIECPADTALLPNATCYLYLWACEQLSATRDDEGNTVYEMQPAETIIDGSMIIVDNVWTYRHESNAGAEAGFVFIEGADDFNMYQVFVDNGEAYEQYIAYRDTGEEWVMCS